MRPNSIWLPLIGAVAVASVGRAAPRVPAATVVQASGDITSVVTQFRQLLGDPLNGTTAGQQPSGRREINWDAVPASFTNTDTFPAQFFNVNSTRGLTVSSPGVGLRLSDTNFADVDSSYAEQFAPFSAPKTFAPVRSTFLDLLPQVAAVGTPAAVRSFGVVFSDVDRLGSAQIEFFRGAQSLGVYTAPARSDAAGLSFVGVVLPEGQFATRVRVVCGEAPLGAGVLDVSAGGTSDLVVVDDFLYGEPQSDTDLDGIPDAVDQRPGSDTRAKVSVDPNGASQTTVDNNPTSDGATVQDLVADSIASSANRKAYLKRIRSLSMQLRRAGVISRADALELNKAAERTKFGAR